MSFGPSSQASRLAVFQSLHQGAAPLLLPNAWDAASALLFQSTGAQAVATSSAAIAWSLGYADGGALPRHELMAAVARIGRVLKVPLTIDLEDGYSDEPDAVAELVEEVAACGVVGINLEDGSRPPALLVEKIRAARRTLAGQGLFINARSDVFLRQLAKADGACAMTIERLREYRQAGADGAFVPGLSRLQEISAIALALDMPLNVMALPGMPPLAQLRAAGVRRFTVGPALFQSAYGHAVKLSKRLLVEHEVSALFEEAIPYEVLNAAF